MTLKGGGGGRGLGWEGWGGWGCSHTPVHMKSGWLGVSVAFPDPANRPLSDPDRLWRGRPIHAKKGARSFGVFQ